VFEVTAKSIRQTTAINEELQQLPSDRQEQQFGTLSVLAPASNEIRVNNSFAQSVLYSWHLLENENEK